MCKFASNKSKFNVTIKVNRKIWLSHYAIKSPDDGPEHDIKFWQFVCLDGAGHEHMLHNHQDPTP